MHLTLHIRQIKQKNYRKLFKIDMSTKHLQFIKWESYFFRLASIWIYGIGITVFDKIGSLIIENQIKFINA